MDSGTTQGAKVIATKALELVNATLQERMRQAKTLNIRITGMEEKEDNTPEGVRKKLRTMQ